ncbi:MAG: hypothetical protein V3T17_04195 [Pseudomonadales bacterium]
MKKNFTIFVLLVLSFSVQVQAMIFTNNGDPYTGGVSIEMVYLGFDAGKIYARASDGIIYNYDMSLTSTGQMPANANAVYSMLLTALSSGKKVNFYFDNNVGGVHKPFTLISIVK